MHPMLITQRRKHRRSNQPRKRHCKNIPRIKNSHSCRNLLACIKHTQDVQRSWVKRRFNEPKAKAHKHESSVVLDQRGEGSHAAPDCAANAHVERGPHFARGHEHVAGDLGEEVADVEDGDARVVLAATET